MQIAHQLSRPLLTVTLVAMLAACGTSSEALDEQELRRADVVVTARDTRFVDTPDELEAGEATIALVNEDRAPHDLTFEGELGTVVEVSGKGGAMATVTLAPGDYVVYCAVGGHREAGMEFELAVG